LNFWYTGYFWN